MNEPVAPKDSELDEAIRVVANESSPAQDALQESHVLQEMIRRKVDLSWLCPEHAAQLLDYAIGGFVGPYQATALRGFQNNQKWELDGRPQKTARLVAMFGELLDKSDVEALESVALARLGRRSTLLAPKRTRSNSFFRRLFEVAPRPSSAAGKITKG